jgi:hypothetical protein
MPPYQNESLHDMHALMQQLDDLNAAHALDHLGAPKKKQKEPATEEPEPAQNTPAKKQSGGGGLAGIAKRGLDGAKQIMWGKPMAAAELQQSFCEIAALVKDWPRPQRESMQKMLQSNDYAKGYCPTDNRYTVPKKL